MGNETSIIDCPHQTSDNCNGSEGLGVICSTVALVGGSRPQEGNIMVNGQPVCDDGSEAYRAATARVVCRELGYDGASQHTTHSYFGQVSNEFGMDEVQCTGNEASIFDCPHQTTDDCGRSEGLGVICSTCTTNCPVVLVGGSGPQEGNIMVNGEPVCDDGSEAYRAATAAVVCRELGYNGASQQTIQSYFGQVSNEFGMDEVQCSGNEASIFDCPHQTSENCGGSEGL